MEDASKKSIIDLSSPVIFTLGHCKNIMRFK
jgi:hypothetical protein